MTYILLIVLSVFTGLFVFPLQKKNTRRGSTITSIINLVIASRFFKILHKANLILPYFLTLTILLYLDFKFNIIKVTFVLFFVLTFMFLVLANVKGKK